MKKTFKEITKDLGVKITAFNIPYERIETDLRLDLNKYKSKSSILQHITKVGNKKQKENIEEEFSTLELHEKLNVILPALEKNRDPRLKYLLKWNGPFCKIIVEKTHKRLIKKAKGVYCFYNKKTFEPLYFGKAAKSYTRFMDYFSITTAKCMYNGQGTSVRINNLINKFVKEGNSIGLALIPMINKSEVDIKKEETKLIYKFRENIPFWNINNS